jgi:hypothetical protein
MPNLPHEPITAAEAVRILRTADDGPLDIPSQPITAAQAARILSTDVRTVHRLILRGKLTGVKAHSGLRAPYLIARAEVETLAASRWREFKSA